MAIAPNITLKDKVKIHHPDLVNVYGCEIGAQSSIGAFVEIRKGVKIGKKVKIQSHVFIPEGVTVGDEVFIGPHVSFTNDIYPRATTIEGKLITESDWKVVNTYVKRRASIGANATILCGITIGEGAIIGAGSVVVKDVESWTIVAGNPAKEIRKISKKTTF